MKREQSEQFFSPRVRMGGSCRVPTTMGRVPIRSRSRHGEIWRGGMGVKTAVTRSSTPSHSLHLFMRALSCESKSVGPSQICMLTQPLPHRLSRMKHRPSEPATQLQADPPPTCMHLTLLRGFMYRKKKKTESRQNTTNGIRCCTNGAIRHMHALCIRWSGWGLPCMQELGFWAQCVAYIPD